MDAPLTRRPYAGRDDDWIVSAGDLEIGRMQRERHVFGRMAWAWSLFIFCREAKPASGVARTFDEARAALRSEWERWKREAGEKGLAWALEHQQDVRARALKNSVS